MDLTVTSLSVLASYYIEVCLTPDSLVLVFLYIYIYIVTPEKVVLAVKLESILLVNWSLET